MPMVWQVFLDATPRSEVARAGASTPPASDA
jgi:hypothetical protein